MTANDQKTPAELARDVASREHQLAWAAEDIQTARHHATEAMKAAARSAKLAAYSGSLLDWQSAERAAILAADATQAPKTKALRLTPTPV